jgi:hypothetical protein
MHVVPVKENQVLHRYAVKGSEFHLCAGKVVIQEAPVYLDNATSFATEIRLHEGAAYTVKKSGWIRIRALQPSELLLQEAPAPGPFRIFWQQCRTVFG